MGSFRSLLPAAATVVLLVAGAAMTDTGLPPNPHAFFNEEGACPDCHSYYGGEVEPHEFVASMPDMCRECHTKAGLGRSHPIGMDPSDSRHDIEVPPHLPLEDKKISCGSCHEPHMEWLSPTKSYKSQKESFVLRQGGEVPYYKTYFLRISDPEKGFTTLCLACHRDY